MLQLLKTISLCVFAGTMIGCGDSASAPPKTLPVMGKVTYQGKPLSTGSIALFPVAASGAANRPATGEIANGEFRLTTFKLNDGVIPGSYKVVVVSQQGGPTLEDPGGKLEWTVPERYAKLETTPLEIEVDSKAREVVLEIPD